MDKVIIISALPMWITTVRMKSFMAQWLSTIMARDCTQQDWDTVIHSTAVISTRIAKDWKYLHVWKTTPERIIAMLLLERFYGDIPQVATADVAWRQTYPMISMVPSSLLVHISMLLPRIQTRHG